MPSTRSKPYTGTSGGSRLSNGSYTTVEPPAGWNTNTGTRDASAGPSGRGRRVRTNPSITPASRYCAHLLGQRLDVLRRPHVLDGDRALGALREALRHLGGLLVVQLGQRIEDAARGLAGDDRPRGERDPLGGVARRHVGVERRGDRLLAERAPASGWGYSLWGRAPTAAPARLGFGCAPFALPLGPDGSVGGGGMGTSEAGGGACCVSGSPCGSGAGAATVPGVAPLIISACIRPSPRTSASSGTRAAARPRRGARPRTRSASPRCRGWRHAPRPTGSAAGRSRIRRGS